MELKKKLGRRIQELRYKNNLKQSELAEAVGIATKSQSCIETGRNYPSADLMERYAKVFKVDMTELFKFSHVMSEEQLISDIISMTKVANNEQLKIIHKVVSAIMR